ncbi:protein-export chaperone SecB [Aurantibacter crassamenti]|uniref:protein-export chaperone SecB n=1 Tax=Aurantibacter crassamenti TaxID=1837375 RepID=UPI001939EB3D|nr:protein-export chaperone SecB [Aurantibacter crassamenti]MBM1106045.1 protein-export chaperone SecB [Aurantibacter crassamenti]
MDNVAFSFDSYRFDKVLIDFQKLNTENINIQFEPSGIFYKDLSKFDLLIKFTATSGDKDIFVEIFSVGTFKFENAKELKDIPTFFYRNAIAIFFPYLRAYVSLVSNQANHTAFILPTLNLSNLETPLKANTIIK